MTTIRTVYFGAPPDFPATDQHPDAVRYGPFTVGGKTCFADCIGGEPTVEDLQAVIDPPPVELTVDQKLANAGLTREDILAIMSEGA